MIAQAGDIRDLVLFSLDDLTDRILEDSGVDHVDELPENVRKVYSALIGVCHLAKREL